MRRILVLAAIAAVALLGTSCKSNSGDIYPMSVGSVWNMDMVVTLDTTTIASPDTFATGTYVVTAVEKADLASGGEVVKMKTEMSQHMKMPDTTISFTTYSYAREAGDWILSYSDLSDSTGDTVMMTTPAVGKKWHQGTDIMEVVGQEDVTVKAGTYKSAWKVKMSNSDVEIFLWYAKGVGLVKVSSETQTPEMMTTLELTKATIK
jgi:hypothetical protein